MGNNKEIINHFLKITSIIVTMIEIISDNIIIIITLKE